MMAMDKLRKAVEIFEKAVKEAEVELGVKEDSIQLNVLVFDHGMYKDIGEDIPDSGYRGATWKRYHTRPDEEFTKGIDFTFYGPREEDRISP